MFRTTLQLEKCFKAFRLLIGLIFAFIFSAISVQAEGPEFCWKDSYGRGVGTFPPQPPATHFRHWFSSELYTCPDGFYRSLNPDINARDACLRDTPAHSKWGPAISMGRIINPAPTSRAFKDPGYNVWFQCPSGFNRTLAHVKAPNACSNGIWPFEETRRVQELKVYQNPLPKGAFGDPNGYYYKCPKGYNRTIFPVTADNACEKVIPAKQEKAKASVVGSACQDKVMDAGLCYDACKKGYVGVGPVCWSNAPKNWVECGAGSAKDDKTCASITTTQVGSTLMLAANVATMGSGSAASVAKKGDKAKELKELKKKYDKLMKELAKVKNTKTFKAGEKALEKHQDAVQGAKNVGKVYKGYMGVKTLTEATTPEDMARAAAQIAAILDPSGVSDVVAAYTYPLCSKYFK